MEQISSSLGTANLLFVGDCKLSALATRAWIATQGHFYLSPLAGTGKTPKLLQAWIEAAVSGQVELTEVEITTATAQDPQLVQGYEVERELEVVVDQQVVRWQERVFILHSPTLKQQQQRGLETRLNTATTKLLALTPTPGRGKRQLTDETQLIEKANAILRQHRVQEFLTYDYELQSTGKPRYQITQFKRHQVMIDAHQARCGWRAYVSNAPPNRLCFTTAVSTYRDEWIIEREFGRLKGLPLSIMPLFVQRFGPSDGLNPFAQFGPQVADPANRLSCADNYNRKHPR